MRPRRRQKEGGMYLTLANDASDLFRRTLTRERTLQRTLTSRTRQRFFLAYTDERILKRTFTTITSDDLLERYVSVELIIVMFHYSIDAMRNETFLH